MPTQNTNPNSSEPQQRTVERPSLFTLEGKWVDLTVPFDGADHAIAPIPCPACKNSESVKVQGMQKRIATDDHAWESYALTTCCGAFVGTMRHEVDTLFGLREDIAMSQLGIRIY